MIEDACQSHLGAVARPRLGTWGDTGCFSFQASKNLNCGDGGAILTNNDEWADQCYSFHNQCRARAGSGSDVAANEQPRRQLPHDRVPGRHPARPDDPPRRPDEDPRAERRYLRSLLKEIPGIVPARMYDGCTRNAYHLFMYRYQKEHFAGLPRKRFLEALEAEGVACSRATAAEQGSRSSRRRSPPAPSSASSRRRPGQLGGAHRCPANDKLSEEAAWFTQTMLLGPRSDMDQIADAIRKIQASAAELASV